MSRHRNTFRPLLAVVTTCCLVTGAAVALAASAPRVMAAGPAMVARPVMAARPAMLPAVPPAAHLVRRARFSRVYLNQRAAWWQMRRRGWGVRQYYCLAVLWHRESGWNHRAANPSSGAYGIPQALPAVKMARAGRDWRTNPRTQIRWGLMYIDGRYGSPCQAWRHFRAHNWY